MGYDMISKRCAGHKSLQHTLFLHLDHHDDAGRAAWVRGGVPARK